MMPPRRLLRPALLSSLVVSSGLLLGFVESFTPANQLNLPAFATTSSVTPSADRRQSSTALRYSDGIGPQTAPRQVEPITSPDHLTQFINEDDRLTIVKVYASWCKTCAVFDLKYRKLARDEGDAVDPTGGTVVRAGRARFAEIEFTSNEELCRSLGATKMPYILAYRSAADGRPVDAREAAAEFVCGPSSFQQVIDLVEAYGGGGDAECQTAECEFERTLERGTQLGDEIVQNLRPTPAATPAASDGNGASTNGAQSFEEFVLSQASSKTQPPPA